MQIKLDDYIVDVEIIYKNNKNIYFRFKEDLKLYVYCSKFITDKQITNLIVENKTAIIKMIQKVSKQISNDSYFYYLNKKYITVISDTDEVYFDDNFVFTKSKEQLNKFYQKECIRLFNERLNVYKEMIRGIPPFRLRIRKMKTRWGVCNRKDNIVTLNSELLKRSISELDYVIVHELCHFFEGNHSSRFYDHVRKYYPNYKESIKKLREVL